MGYREASSRVNRSACLAGPPMLSRVITRRMSVFRMTSERCDPRRVTA